MHVIAQLTARWNALPAAIRFTAATAAFASIVLAVAAAIATHPPRSPLFASPLHSEQVAEVEERLAEWNVPFTPTADNVVVDTRRRNDLLLRLSLGGIPHLASSYDQRSVGKRRRACTAGGCRRASKGGFSRGDRSRFTRHRRSRRRARHHRAGRAGRVRRPNGEQRQRERSTARSWERLVARSHSRHSRLCCGQRAETRSIACNDLGRSRDSPARCRLGRRRGGGASAGAAIGARYGVRQRRYDRSHSRRVRRPADDRARRAARADGSTADRANSAQRELRRQRAALPASRRRAGRRQRHARADRSSRCREVGAALDGGVSSIEAAGWRSSRCAILLRLPSGTTRDAATLWSLTRSIFDRRRFA